MVCALETCGKAETSARILSTSAWTAGSRTLEPAGTAKTIRSVSPDAWGRADLRRFSAWVDSVLGRLNDCVKAEPTMFDAAIMATRTTSQMPTTARRCRTHQVASARMGFCSSGG